MNVKYVRPKSVDIFKIGVGVLAVILAATGQISWWIVLLLALNTMSFTLEIS